MKKIREKSSANIEKLRWYIVFAAIFLATGVVFAFFELRVYYQRRESNLYMAANQVKLMDSSLSETMSRVYTLRLLVTTNEGSTDFFDDISEAFYEETAEDTGLTVKNFILAPGGKVEKIYPLEGNESLIGFDYMDETQAGNAEAVEAYKENKLILTEPFSLKQGGTGIAARLPVYIDGDDGKEFWGLVAVTLDMDYLLDTFNLDYLRDSGVKYSLWYEAAGGVKTVIESSGDEMTNPVSGAMISNNLIWMLDVEPEDGWTPLSEIIIGFAAVTAISLIITHLLASRSHIRDMNAILQEIAIKDNLTGCYSRHFVNVMLLKPDSREWKEESDCYSLAVIDVDDFKHVNDNYGHNVGDQALVALADVLKGLCDDLRGDCVIRYGGDEFIFLMNNVTRKLFEERLNGILEKAKEIKLEGAPDFHFTVSIGAVSDTGKHTYDELFARADEQIYISKNSGKNQIHIVDFS